MLDILGHCKMSRRAREELTKIRSLVSMGKSCIGTAYDCEAYQKQVETFLKHWSVHSFTVKEIRK
jgi:hypothetical protein